MSTTSYCRNLFAISLLLILLWMIVGCQSERPLATQPISIPPTLAQTTVNSEPTAPLQTETPTPSSSSTPTPSVTPAPTAVPTTTPLPLAKLFIPTKWQDIAQSVIIELNASHPSYQWILTANEQNAHIRLVDSDDNPIHQEPLALVVPYNASWDNTDEITAKGVIDNGHRLASVMPWRDITRTQKAIRIDGRFPTDSDYPFYETWSLVGEADYEAAVAAATPILQNLMTDTAIHIAAVGDIMLDRTLGNVIEDGGIEFPFKLVADHLQQADITVGNLETALGDAGEPAEKSYTFQSPPAAAESLAWGGFDVISLANNHAMDYGTESLLQGIDLLKAQGIAPIGAGVNAEDARSPHITSTHGLNIAFLSYVHVPVEARGNFFDTATWTATEATPGLAWANPDEIIEDVTAVSSQVDLVVVVLHSGYEYVEPPSEEQAAAAHAAIDAGADIVIGHHAHILQAVEFYKNGVIAYGLGNFAFNIDGNANTAILNVWLDEKAGVRQFEFIPAIVQYGGQPRLANPQESAAILKHIYHLSQGFPVTSPDSTE